ncbi:hypothetical protein O6H91_19G053500 [Diphasiastrum complanatum]|uniref:Uncharacterized protein n=1 Tax=Diphasiastrum complanatum TaxID=34168 RepID=A0ACC2AV70_DIPCM|nr:hypothetical protein O6H91_19G053500 [Diphasiastrum complanatum]
MGCRHWYLHYIRLDKMNCLLELVGSHTEHSAPYAGKTMTLNKSSPIQADLLITAGTVTMKMASSLVRLYEQIPEPKYVIAMGACTITRRMFSTDSYSTVCGVDKSIPVDVYLPDLRR